MADFYKNGHYIGPTKWSILIVVIHHEIGKILYREDSGVLLEELYKEYCEFPKLMRAEFYSYNSTINGEDSSASTNNISCDLKFSFEYIPE